MLKSGAESIFPKHYYLIGGVFYSSALMLVVGKVIKITRDGKLLIKAEALPKLGAQVYDSTANVIGYVYDIIGPVSSPYVVVKVSSPRIKQPEYLLNRLLYTHEVSKVRVSGK
ncbi:MAG: Gar1/Naf1 family protein [Thermofilaceae archaeon]|nr:Gar1/Naf1 family protein [Thermofilaceae archaeon]